MIIDEMANCSTKQNRDEFETEWILQQLKNEDYVETQESGVKVRVVEGVTLIHFQGIPLSNCKIKLHMYSH